MDCRRVTWMSSIPDQPKCPCSACPKISTCDQRKPRPLTIGPDFNILPLAPVCQSVPRDRQRMDHTMPPFSDATGRPLCSTAVAKKYYDDSLYNVNPTDEYKYRWKNETCATPTKLTGYKTLPFARPIPRYDGFKPRFPYPLPKLVPRPTIIELTSSMREKEMNDRGKISPTYQVYLIRYSYDPVQYSPNDNPDIELPLTAGDYVFIYGEMDEDEFFEGELMDGRRGLVPSNFVEKVPAEDLEDFHLRPPSLRNGNGNSNGHASLLEKNSNKSKHQKDGIDIDTSAATKDRSGNDGSAPLHRHIADLSSPSASMINGNREQATPIAITEIIDPIDVPPPTDLRLERQLSTSFIIAWKAPAELPPEQVVSYNVYSNELFLTTVKGNDRCKALLEKLDPFKKHQISVRTVTSRGQSRDHLCSITIGSGGLMPDSEHVVIVCALDPDKLVPTTQSTSITFITLPEDLPDAPVDVQIEVGPQRGTLLVTWMPALRHKQPAAAVTVTPKATCDVVNRAAITGYVVYVDGTKVKQLDSPSGDHVLLDSRCFSSFPADPKLVTVRTAAAGDRESRDSRPAQLSHQMLEEIRTGMLLTEVELNTGTAGGPGSRNASDSTGSSPIGDYTPSVDSSTGGGRDGFVSRSRHGNKLHYGSRLHPRAVPHIEITRDALSGGSSGADDSDGSSTRHRTSTSGATARRRAKQSGDSAMMRQDETIRLHDDAPAGASRHRSRQDAADWTAAGGRRRNIVRGEDPLGTDFLNSDPEVVDDALLIGGDSDLEVGHRGPAHSRSHVHGHAHRTRGAPMYRVFIALFDYEPSSMSPNPGAVDEELPFCEGQLIKIHGDKDADGFYLGEVEGRYGLVPCNMVSEVHVDSPDIAERLLRENSPTPPPGYSGGARGASGRAAPSIGGTPPRAGRPRQHRLDAHEQQRRPIVDPSVMRSRLPAARKMIAIYDYNPHELSPNVDVETELPFKMGDVITVFGDVDYDGFYRGKLGARRGLVPSNYLRPSPHHHQTPPPPPLPHHSSPDVGDLGIGRQVPPLRSGSSPVVLNPRDQQQQPPLPGVVDGQSRMPRSPASRDPVVPQAENGVGEMRMRRNYGSPGQSSAAAAAASAEMESNMKHRRIRDPP